ncbi:MAG: DUF4271 domain-containing protein [Bacteroidia bacterium]|nr:DUF4271 domain-containing protein [Bacteroidia bacterium]
MLRNIIINDWFTASIIVCLLFIAVTKLLFPNRFNDFIEILGNSNYLKIYVKDQRFINIFDGLLFMNLVISLTIFVSLYISVMDNNLQEQSLALYYKLFVGIGSLLIIKALTDRLIGSLFDIDELMNEYVFQKITYKNYIGLVLLPINIILLYALIPSKSIISIAIFILFIVGFMGFLESVKSHLKLLKVNLFYFILYLCALEIAPYIILYKVLNS